MPKSRVSIIECARLGQASAVSDLLAGGADVNATDEDGSTALIVAASRNDMDTVGVLVAAGSRVGVEDHLGCSPLFWAGRNENQAMIDLLKTTLENQLRNDHSPVLPVRKR